FAGIFALGAALNMVLEIGIENIQQRVLQLNRRLTSLLAESGWTVLSPLRDDRVRSAETLVSVANPAETVRSLFRRGIVVTEKPEGIRVATHFFNNEEDLEKLIGALNSSRG